MSRANLRQRILGPHLLVFIVFSYSRPYLISQFWLIMTVSRNPKSSTATGGSKAGDSESFRANEVRFLQEQNRQVRGDLPSLGNRIA